MLKMNINFDVYFSFILQKYHVNYQPAHSEHYTSAQANGVGVFLWIDRKRLQHCLVKNVEVDVDGSIYRTDGILPTLLAARAGSFCIL